MNRETIQRYQPGGDLYVKASAKYGSLAADDIARAALTGDQREVNAAFQRALKYGAPLETSTGKIFVEQITTDPFAAPLDAANTGLGNVFGSAISGVFRNPWVLLVVVVAIFYALGGFRAGARLKLG